MEVKFKNQPSLMASPLESLLLIDEPQLGRSGGLNMAIDELLLCDCENPWLRWYAWDEPTLSIGHFEPLPANANLPVIRRWTGGGLVRHGGEGDYTFALGLPRSQPHALLRPTTSYQWIHSALCAALSLVNVSVELADPVQVSTPGGSCFANPVPADLVAPNGQKLAGGAQRRTRHGMLHQGSLQTLSLPDDFAECFATELCPNWEKADLPKGLLSRAKRLASVKYPPITV